MKIIQFENETPRTRFAPVFNYYIYESTVDVKNLKSIILSKEKEIVRDYPYTSDWNTGLGDSSMRSISNCYNVIKW